MASLLSTSFSFRSASLHLSCCDPLPPQPQVWRGPFSWPWGKAEVPSPWLLLLSQLLGRVPGTVLWAWAEVLLHPLRKRMWSWVLTVSPRCPWDSDAQPPQLRRPPVILVAAGAQVSPKLGALGGRHSPCSTAGGSPAALSFEPWIPLQPCLSRLSHALLASASTTGGWGWNLVSGNLVHLGFRQKRWWNSGETQGREVVLDCSYPSHL